jgi:hypothetical protein
MALKHASHGVNKLIGERRGEKIQSGRCRVRPVCKAVHPCQRTVLQDIMV